MNDFEEYIRQGEPQKREKGYAWQTAIGLQAVDDLKPSEYLIQTARQHIEGDITIEEAKQLIDSYYQSKTIRADIEDRTEEADKVSARIAEILSEKTFTFSPVEYITIHRRLFQGIYKFAGKIRDYNITKKEWVLKGETVLYASADSIRETLDYDFMQEKNFSYKDLNINDAITHIAKFISGVWQIHAFGEGNTRTTAVFTIKYLRTFGFDISNEAFANHSWYFRMESVYLKRFFRNLLMGENNELRNRFMVINAPKDMGISTPTSTPTSSDNPLQIDNENISRLIKAIANNRLSVNERLQELRRGATTLFRNPARGAQPACRGSTHLLQPACRRYATSDEAVCIPMSAATTQ